MINPIKVTATKISVTKLMKSQLGENIVRKSFEGEKLFFKYLVKSLLISEFLPKRIIDPDDNFRGTFRYEWVNPYAAGG